jgi:AbrB family looped-hinge helix DNA binding protein
MEKIKEDQYLQTAAIGLISSSDICSKRFKPPNRTMQPTQKAARLIKSVGLTELTNSIDSAIVILYRDRWRCYMQTVTVSPKYQVVIPKNIRDSLKLRPGQKLRVIEYDGRIELIPDRDISELRGFLKGIDTRLEREKDRV